jgi:hypothetical protein
MTKPNVIISIDGVNYVREDAVVAKPTGNRFVVVADRGWIFAGDLTEVDGKIFLDRAINIRRWSSIAFNGMIENPKSDKVTLDVMKNTVEFPKGSILFTIPVSENWGF